MNRTTLDAEGAATPAPPPLARRWRRRGRCALGLAAAFGVAWGAFEAWVATAPVPDLRLELSAEVVDREGRLLRAYQVADGRWRLSLPADQVDRGYLAQLLAYEDKRFFRHAGVDPLALGRAAWQALVHGRPVSGASTLTMQVARLLQERPTRTLGAKLAQIRLALALERRLTKRRILELYLARAPFGGNLEGVRAASLTWFGKEPRRLTPAEAALLVALPQSPEGRRPDRHADAAQRARDRVLDRAVAEGALAAGDARAAKRTPVPTRRRAFPAHAPHLADRARAEAPGQRRLHLAIDRDLQARLETWLAESAATWPKPRSAAVLVVDHRTGEILAHLGSTGFTDLDRSGFIDMTRAVRSPGSTLKPLIYALAFDQGLAHPESLVEDRPTSFGGYVPTNFDRGYDGTVSVRTALQRSLNVPAVVLLDGVGPALLMAAMRRAGMDPRLPPGKAPGLAIGLGGVGVSLTDLAAMYAAIARGGPAVRLRATPGPAEQGARVIGPRAAWHVADILAGAPAPLTARNGQLAFKTGTSYGYRDAWAVGFDGAHVIAVWVGRADAAPVPDMTGIRTAAPLLFQAFTRLKPTAEPLKAPPEDTMIVAHAELPPPLRHVRSRYGAAEARGPEIAFPPDGARVDTGGGALALKVRDGFPPFTWLVDGAPVRTQSLEREIAWRAAGSGFVSIAVIDARGQAARARVFVE